MATMPSHNAEERDDAATRKALSEADRAFPFGPSFFLLHLARFVRDSCPDPAERLPAVQLHLADGDTLDVCHCIGVSPRWALLAVPDTTGHREGMAIECVPFQLIQRVSIHTRRPEGTSLGFSQHQAPSVMAAESLLQAAMATHHESS